MADQRPLVGVTLGDPAGIGPEVVAKALADRSVYDVARPLTIGSETALLNAIQTSRLQFDCRPIDHPSQGSYQHGAIDLLPVSTPEHETVEPGQVQAAAGRLAFESIRAAVDLALRGELDAMATAPVSKEALREASVPYLDHTEILGALTGSSDALTMFSLPRLKIFFMARHMSLADSISEVTAENVFRTLQKAHAAMERFRQPNARFGVAALNPHAGEGGLFGREEIEHVHPGIERAVAAGIQAFGPIPADAVFHLALQGRFDAVLSLYHDQGHVAAKTLDFERTVAVTTGLPFIRTSVDHGTAYDIAGKGVASAIGMVEAIKAAAHYAHLTQIPSPLAGEGQGGG